MADDPVEVVREAFRAFLGGDLATLRTWVAPDLEWTYLDPSVANPEPATCFGRDQLEAGVGRWSSMGLSTDLEELEGRGDKVVIVLHTPGLDSFRARSADDRNFHVVTVRDGRVSAIRACRDRTEARALAGFVSIGGSS